jgi:hypothetical protein
MDVKKHYGISNEQTGSENEQKKRQILVNLPLYVLTRISFTE